jgi:hypothetical protein
VREAAAAVRDAIAAMRKAGEPENALEGALEELARRCDILAEATEKRASWHVQLYAETLVRSLAQATLVAVLVLSGKRDGSD